LPLSWIEQINLHLPGQRNKYPQKPIVLVGVGNLLMGDDAAGILVIHELMTGLPAGSTLVPIDAGPAPENFTGQIRQLHPGLVIFVDAGKMEEPPGTIRLVTCREAEGVSAFGHTLPLSVLGGYLESELDCDCLLLVIQPQVIEFDAQPTEKVLDAVKEISRFFLNLNQ
jgi:hydrogenase 3 maturation protease